MTTPPPILLSFVIAAALARTALADDQPANSAPAPEVARVDEAATHSSGKVGDAIVASARDLEAMGFSGSVLAARDGRVVAAFGVGMADAAKGTPNTAATLFEIASLTKPFTAAAALRLAQRDPAPLALGDPIAKHLPGVPESCRLITVEHLLRHTSGIPGSNSAGSGDDLAKVLPVFLRGGPRQAPGERFEYWNQGYALASEVIARAGGKPYTEVCREELFGPAGMARTLFNGDVAPNGSVVAIGGGAIGPERSALDHPYGGAYGFQYRGMGGIVTTVWDLWRFDRALRASEQGQAGAMLSPASVGAMFKAGPGNYGLGWELSADPELGPVQMHSGRVRGFVALMKRIPGRDAVIIVLCNRDDAPLREAAARLEAVLFERPIPADPRAAKVLPLTAAQGAGLAGKYATETGATLVVLVEGGATRGVLTWGRGRGAPVTRGVIGLSAKGEPVYFDGKDEVPLTISRGADGSVTSLSILTMTFRRAVNGDGGAKP